MLGKCSIHDRIIHYLTCTSILIDDTNLQKNPHIASLPGHKSYLTATFRLKIRF